MELSLELDGFMLCSLPLHYKGPKGVSVKSRLVLRKDSVEHFRARQHSDKEHNIIRTLGNFVEYVVLKNVVCSVNPAP